MKAYLCLQTIQDLDIKHIFRNTKILNQLLYTFQRMDLGECPKVHDLALRADYEQATATKDYFYDIDVSPVPW